LEEHGWTVVHTEIVADEFDSIATALITSTDTLGVRLCATAGGTGFSQRDITPEASKSVYDREAPGLPEQMRRRSMETGSTGILSRQTAGLRGKTLIINLPGSRSAAVECYMSVAHALRHAIEMLDSEGSSCHAESAEKPKPENAAKVTAVCVGNSPRGRKSEAKAIQLIKGSGALGDAYDEEVPVFIFPLEEVNRLQDESPITLKPGIFSENILAAGLPPLSEGSVLRIGDAKLEVIKTNGELPTESPAFGAFGEAPLAAGVHARVIESGAVKAGDAIILEN
jgi:molybdenum cofactor synthesis domain-containing protein